MGERPGTKIGGMTCGLFHSRMDGACNSVRMHANGRKRYMHSGDTFVLLAKRNISNRNLSVVFVFQ